MQHDTLRLAVYTAMLDYEKCCLFTGRLLHRYLPTAGPTVFWFSFQKNLQPSVSRILSFPTPSEWYLNDYSPTKIANNCLCSNRQRKRIGSLPNCFHRQ